MLVGWRVIVFADFLQQPGELTGQLLPILAYVAPSYALKEESLKATSGVTLLVMVLVTLPFMWIGVTMSVRRAEFSAA